MAWQPSPEGIKAAGLAYWRDVGEWAEQVVVRMIEALLAVDEAAIRKDERMKAAADWMDADRLAYEKFRAAIRQDAEDRIVERAVAVVRDLRVDSWLYAADVLERLHREGKL